MKPLHGLLFFVLISLIFLEHLVQCCAIEAGNGFDATDGYNDDDGDADEDDDSDEDDADEGDADEDDADEDDADEDDADEDDADEDDVDDDRKSTFKPNALFTPYNDKTSTDEYNDVDGDADDKENVFDNFPYQGNDMGMYRKPDPSFCEPDSDEEVGSFGTSLDNQKYSPPRSGKVNPTWIFKLEKPKNLGNHPNYGGIRTKYGSKGTNYGGKNTEYGGKDASSGSKKTKYGGKYTSYGGKNTEFGAGDTIYGGEKTKYEGNKKTYGGKHYKIL